MCERHLVFVRVSMPDVIPFADAMDQGIGYIILTIMLFFALFEVQT